ncbi:MAG: formyltransferase family protein [Acidimicrobiia bacterium]
MSARPLLRLAVLTTDTAHHRWFLQQLHEHLAGVATIDLTVFETKAYPWERNRKRFVRESMPNLWKAYARNPYVTSSKLSTLIDAYEERSFFPNGDDSLPDSIPVLTTKSVNDQAVLDALDAVQPDLALVYGTGLVKPPVFERPRITTVNAHGGSLPGYRGLDTNLWATYLGHPEHMAVTLHQVDDHIDTGHVYTSRPIGAPSDLSLLSLRFHTTLVCTAMFVDLVHAFAGGQPEATPQTGEGRYFKPMPPALKKRTDALLRAYAGRTAAQTPERSAATV